LPAPGGARRCRPGGDRLRREPHGQAAASAQGGIVLGPVGHPVPLLGDVMAIGCLGFERHGRDPSVREGAVVLHRPAPDANRPDPCNKVPLIRLGTARVANFSVYVTHLLIIEVINLLKR
jgi:hypothetical protein